MSTRTAAPPAALRLAAAFCLVVCPGVGLADGPERSTAEEVVRSYLHRYSEVKSLLVTYKAGASANGVDLLHGGYVLTTLGVEGRSRYASTAHIIEPGMKALDDSTYNISLYDGRSFNAVYPVERVYTTSVRFATPDYTIKVRGEPILECLSWWPRGDDSEPPEFRGKPFFLVSILQEKAPSFRGGAEVIGSRSCHVIELPDLDVLWFDTREGHLVRRRHYFDETKKFAMQYDLADFRSVPGGPTLPYRIKRAVVDTGAGKSISEDDYEVTDYKVNTLTDSFFRYEPPAGTLVFDRDTDLCHQIPGGLDFLDETVTRVKKMVGPLPARTGGRRLWSPLIVGGAALASGACALLLAGGRAGRGDTRPVAGGEEARAI